ncbi:hypothetical protein DCMF_17115 [Candidatus Formimonas warabiya]|uniref:P-type Ca(2+) transporter n=2 Tax=Formimonas warabiya TaxID=1761012 RepID=A0A3G1L1M2_FORW1|nr:hypothetical protein DCMF_17115 [Candidatus Formimonas warabiya]
MKNFVQPVKPWHALTAEETIHELHSHLNQGLTCDQTPGMLDTLGPNQFYQPPPASLLARFFSQLKDFMIQLLLGASIVSFVLGERVDAVTILGIVCLESFIGMIQEHHAEQALAALKELAAPVARVTREGKNLLIPAREIVPGDLILLEPGDRVPADARLIEGSSLEVEEAALTGESLSVAKEGNRSLPEETAVADRNNMVFMGTHVTGGRAKATVVNTGMSTEMGRIAALLENTEEESTPLQKYLDQLGKQITSGCLAVCACMVIMGCLRGQSRFHMLRTGISLAVGAIPEGLPAVVTIALAFGVGRMVKGNAIIRRLPAVENLGNTQVICTDKTGTLTKNEMTVKQVYSSGKTWHVTGSGYTPEGEFFLDGEKMIPSADPNLLGILTIGALCNNAKMEKSGIAGDPTDCAVLVAAAKAGIGPETAGAFLRRKEAPFDATRKAMSVVCQDREGKLALYVKGAPEAILEKCTKSFQDGRLELLTPEKKKEISAAGESMADNALRVIATAYKTIRPSGINEDPSVLEENLIFSGLLGMEDPPKQGVVEAVAACHEAGIKVIMVTGDHVHTGEAIARQIGLLTPVGKSLTGNQLDHLDDKDLAAMIDEVEIFARTSPEHKLRIVKAFKSKGYIVAMTGDGVNDAPAVKEADIGIAMGRSGTDVTSASADVVLTDDNFPTIVLAIKEGRGIKENIRTSIRYVLAGNFGEVLAMFLAVLAGQPVPLIPNQILWVNLVTESFPALALGGAPPGSHFIPANRRFMDRHQWRGLFLRGLLAGAATYGIFAFSLRSGASLVKARTLGFASLILNQMFHAFDCNAASGQKKHPRELFMAVGLSTALMLGAIYFPGCGPVFSTVPLRGTDWLMVLLSAGVLGRLDLVLRHLSLPPATKT